jgi:hypothetical protein
MPFFTQAVTMPANPTDAFFTTVGPQSSTREGGEPVALPISAAWVKRGVFLAQLHVQTMFVNATPKALGSSVAIVKYLMLLVAELMDNVWTELVESVAVSVATTALDVS